MKKRRALGGAAWVLAVGLAGGGVAALERPSLEDLVFASGKFDGREVEVKGEARGIEERKGRGGKAYTLFRLIGRKGRWVKVFVWGSPTLYEGRAVTVTGTFWAEKLAGEFSFRKQIEAAEVR